MAQTSWPFENIDTTETQFSQWARNINEGIRQGSGSELAVSAPGGGMTVQVAAGQAMIRGHYYSNSATETLTITTADATNPRIDSVVLELDPSANTVILKVLAGTPAGSPTAPSLTQTDSGIYQIRLANVAVAAGALAITSGNLTDLRTYMFAGIGKWTTATRPANPVANQTTGYNTTIGAHEFWNGTSWVGFADPITTEGDLIVGGASGVPERLPVGANDQVLTVVSGVPAWADASGGSALNYFVNDSTTVSVANGIYKVERYATSTLPNIAPMTINGQSVTSSQFLEVTDGEIEFTLTDAWTARSSSFTTEIRGMTFANGLFVAGGGQAQLSTSTDGITWTSRTSGFGTSGIRAVTFGLSTYVIGGVGGTLTTSTDGTTWTTRTSGFGSTTINALGFGNNLFLAGGDVGTLTTSTDAITWTTRTSGSVNSILGIAFGNSTYVHVGISSGIWSSTDGITWTSRGLGFANALRFVLFADGKFITGGAGALFRQSTDGITWTNTPSSVGTTELYAATYGDGLFVVAGADRSLHTSTDAITWTSRTSGQSSTTVDTRAAAFGVSTYVIADESGGIYTSLTAEGEPQSGYVVIESFGNSVTIP